MASGVLNRPATAQPTKGTALDVRYQEKDQAKALGAIWDNDLRLWYVPTGRDLRPFLRWLPRHVRLLDAAEQDDGQASATITHSP
jgi:hypothetical protein